MSDGTPRGRSWWVTPAVATAGLPAVWVAGLAHKGHAIEHDLTQRAQERLRNTFSQLDVVVDGRDVRLSGPLEDPADGRSAAQLVRSLTGVRNVSVRYWDAPARPLPQLQVTSLPGGFLVASGLLPTADDQRALNEALSTRASGVVTNGLTVSASAGPIEPTMTTALVDLVRTLPRDPAGPVTMTWDTRAIELHGDLDNSMDRVALLAAAERVGLPVRETLTIVQPSTETTTTAPAVSSTATTAPTTTESLATTSTAPPTTSTTAPTVESPADAAPAATAVVPAPPAPSVDAAQAAVVSADTPADFAPLEITSSPEGATVRGAVGDETSHAAVVFFLGLTFGADRVTDELVVVPGAPTVGPAEAMELASNERTDPSQFALQMTQLPAVPFEIGSVELDDDSMAVVLDVAEVLRRAPAGTKVVVVGHTDSQGPSDHNVLVSQQRAETVRLALVFAGVDAAILSGRAAGDAEPLVEERTWADRAINRRVSFELR